MPCDAQISSLIGSWEQPSWGKTTMTTWGSTTSGIWNRSCQLNHISWVEFCWPSNSKANHCQSPQVHFPDLWDYEARCSNIHDQSWSMIEKKFVGWGCLQDISEFPWQKVYVFWSIFPAQIQPEVFVGSKALGLSASLRAAWILPAFVRWSGFLFDYGAPWLDEICWIATAATAAKRMGISWDNGDIVRL